MCPDIMSRIHPLNIRLEGLGVVGLIILPFRVKYFWPHYYVHIAIPRLDPLLP